MITPNDIDMKKNIAPLIALLVLCLSACIGNKNDKAPTHDRIDSVQTVNDSTIYGICGEESGMNSVQLITDQGDSLRFLIHPDEPNVIKGGLMTGDRLAVVPGIHLDGEPTARLVVNLTTLMGKWMSIDKNFEIEEGGIVVSSQPAEKHPWTSWQLFNGRLLLNRDTFDIVELGADSLYIENPKGIYTYERKH